jgi:hypothetical protein
MNGESDDAAGSHLGDAGAEPTESGLELPGLASARGGCSNSSNYPVSGVP